MHNQELRLSYQEAIQLIRVGRYEEALTLLRDIDEEHPHVKNVLYPMAVCYERLGRVDEGLDICEQLIARYDHEKAREIKARLELSIAYPEAQEVSEKEKSLAVGAEEVEASYEPLPEVPETPVEAEPENESEADEEAETPLSDELPREEPKRHKRSIWQVLLIAFLAAAVVAIIIHLVWRNFSDLILL